MTSMISTRFLVDVLSTTPAISLCIYTRCLRSITRTNTYTTAKLATIAQKRPICMTPMTKALTSSF